MPINKDKIDPLMAKKIAEELSRHRPMFEQSLLEKRTASQISEKIEQDIANSLYTSSDEEPETIFAETLIRAREKMKGVYRSPKYIIIPDSLYDRAKKDGLLPPFTLRQSDCVIVPPEENNDDVS